MRGEQQLDLLFSLQQLCFGNAAAICEEDEETCPYFHECGQVIIDEVIEALRRTIR